MKYLLKIKFLIVIVSVLIMNITLTEKSFSQTSMIEYEYVTNGYKTQAESGFEMKEGYKSETLNTIERGSRTATLKAVYRSGNGRSEKAAYLIEYTKKGDAKEYICIPHPKSDQEVLDLFWNNLSTNDNILFADNAAKLHIITFLISQNLQW